MSLQQIVFLILFIAVVFLAYRSYGRIIKAIKLGKSYTAEGSKGQRWKNVFLVAFGQQKMFKRWIPALLHLFIYVAFLFTQIELVEIIIDGVSGHHRFFADKIGPLYNVIINFIEILSVLAFVSTLIFLWRRNLLKIPRFVKPEMDGWPRLDANLILIGEIILIFGIFSMNSADLALQNLADSHYPDTGQLLISSLVFENRLQDMSQSSLIVMERFGWWLHLSVVFGFILYLPYSKHLHILFAFPNVYFASLKARGAIENMPVITNEVKSMMGLTDETGSEITDELPEFGAKDVTDLSWKNILDAYSCTECGRCTSVCPANLTGKKLSPRKILMDIRDRSTEIITQLDGSVKESDFDDGKSLFDYISEEEIFACTTCNACVEACPVMIDPLSPIIELRRYKLLTESKGPSEWMPMYNAIENNGAVWQMPGQRFDWANNLESN